MPTQVAPQSVTAARAPSALLLPIPEYRVRQFAQGVGERLRESLAKGVSEAEVLASIRTERQALAEALGHENFRAAFAHSYQQQFNALSPSATLSMAAAREATDDIISNRINDALTLAQLVTQPAFIAQARAAEATPRGAYKLPPEKIAEMVGRFAEDTSPHGIDGITHAQQAMAGHRIGHLALTQAYQENGTLLQVLAQELMPHLQDEATAQRLAADWLEARRKPAQATAETLRENGEVYNAVLQRIRAAQAWQTVPKPAAPIQTTASVSMPGFGPLMGTTALTPIEAERSKNSRQRASEWAYTLNHALSCGTTDIFIQPFVANAVSKRVDNGTMPKGLRWISNIFEQHHHGDGHDHPPSIKGSLGHWFGGELAGDVGAVPLTVYTQRLFPGFMQGIRHVLEPMFGGVFHRGAERDARRWAVRQETLPDNAQIAVKAQQLYEYEMEHLPQALMWNVYAIPLNLLTQRHLMHSTQSWSALIAGKTFGTLVSNVALVGGRALAPEKFHRWDNFSGRLFGAHGPADELLPPPAASIEQGGWKGRLTEPNGAEAQLPR